MKLHEPTREYNCIFAVTLSMLQNVFYECNAAWSFDYVLALSCHTIRVMLLWIQHLAVKPLRKSFASDWRVYFSFRVNLLSASAHHRGGGAREIAARGGGAFQFCTPPALQVRALVTPLTFNGSDLKATRSRSCYYFTLQKLMTAKCCRQFARSNKSTWWHIAMKIYRGAACTLRPPFVSMPYLSRASFRAGGIATDVMVEKTRHIKYYLTTAAGMNNSVRCALRFNSPHPLLALV